MTQKKFFLTVVWLFIAASSFPVSGDVLEDRTVHEALEGANFYILPRVNYKGSFWIIDQDNNNIIGHAPWDPVRHRWTLFTLSDEYYGFIQATMGSTKPPNFQQYLWYDKNNRYKGVFIKHLGGNPVTPKLPYGELGGELALYDYGNVLLPLPSYKIEVNPLRQFPDGVDISPVEPPARR